MEQAPSDNCIVKIKSVIVHEDFAERSLRLICARYTNDGVLLELESCAIDTEECVWEGQALIGSKDEVIQVMLWQDDGTLKPVTTGAYFNAEKKKGE